jgi:hypothetical protein
LPPEGYIQIKYIYIYNKYFLKNLKIGRGRVGPEWVVWFGAWPKTQFPSPRTLITPPYDHMTLLV